MWCQLRQTLKNTTVAQEQCHHQRRLCPKTPGEGLLLILFDLHILIHHVFRYVPQGKPLDQHHRLRVRCRENRSPRYHSWILRGAKTSSPCRSSQISLEQKSGSDYRDWRRLSISSISSSRCKLLFPLLAVVVGLKSAATATAVVSANWPASYAETTQADWSSVWNLQVLCLLQENRPTIRYVIINYFRIINIWNIFLRHISYHFFFVQLTSWGIL